HRAGRARVQRQGRAPPDAAISPHRARHAAAGSTVSTPRSQPGRPDGIMRWAKALWSWREVVATTATWCSASVMVRPFTGPSVPQKMMHLYFDRVIRQMGIDIIATGTEKVVPAMPCVIAVNHNSLLDVPVVGTILPVDYKWVSKKEIFYVPFIGWHLWA